MTTVGEAADDPCGSGPLLGLPLPRAYWFVAFRKLWKSAGKLNRNWRDGAEDVPRSPSVVGEANLVGSEAQGIPGYHLPVLDLDFPIHAEPSSTEDHYHLYLNKLITWEQYEAILKAFFDAGLIEEGWYEMSVRRRQGFVRYPGVRKLPDEEGSG